MKNHHTLLIVFIFLIMGVISQFKINPQLDEVESHIPTVLSFYNNNIFEAITNEDYKSASTPIPYIFVATIHRIIGIEPSIYTVRIVNMVISVSCLIILFMLIPKTKSFFALLIILFYPYYIKPTFTFFMAIYGLLFFLLFIYFAEGKQKENYFLAGLFLTLAILSQQFYLVVLVLFVLYKVYNWVRTTDVSYSIIRLTWFSIPFLLVGLLFFIWGGLTHPSYKQWGVSFHMEYLTSVITVIGTISFPYFVGSVKDISYKKILLLFLMAIPAVLFAFPQWVNAPTEGGISGYSFHFFAILEKHNLLLGVFLKSVFLTVGLLILESIFFSFDKSKINLRIFLAALILGFSINKLPSERHMLPLVITVFLILLENVEEKVLKNFWLPYQIVIGIVYFVYLTFFYKMGLS